MEERGDASRPTTERLPAHPRRQNPQLESDSLATTPQGAFEGYFPSSEETSTAVTPNDPAQAGRGQDRDLSSEGGLRRLRESLSTHSERSERQLRPSTNAEEGIALPDNVKDFGKRRRVPTPPRLQTDSVTLPNAEEKAAVRDDAALAPVAYHRKAGSVVAPEVHRAFPSAGSRTTSIRDQGRFAKAVSSRPPVRTDGGASRSTQAPPFSLAGAGPRLPSSFATRHSHDKPPPGVAIPRPRPRDGPSWASKARRKPLYSLGKPLPTHEEVQAQKEWEEQMKRIKQRYPDAEPPAPPPLPSQQDTSGVVGGGGLQLDRGQLQDVIRTVIAEFRSYENGTLDLDSVSTGSVDLRPPRRPSFYDPVSSVTARRAKVAGDDTDGGSHLASIDSVVVEDDEDEPLPATGTPNRPRPPRISSRKQKPRRERPSSGSAKQSAFANDGRKEEQERESIAREWLDKQDESRPDKPQPALPSEPKHRSSRSSDTTVAEAAPVKQAAPRDRPPSQASRILSRDHEQEGNWSEDDNDPHQTEEDTPNSDFPNPLAELRSRFREPAAEFLGAMALGLIGIGASMQNGLLANPAISLNGQGSLSAAVDVGRPLAWGAGVAISIYIAGGISGGHISPVITTVLWLFRGFPARKVPEYILAQIGGFTAGSSIAYGLYRHAISIVEGNGATRTLGNNGTGSYFATYPVEYLSNANAFFNEAVAVAVLVVLVLAIGDATNVPPPAGLNPLILMFTVVAIGLALGSQTGYALNPARDLGPRLVSWFAGYGTDVWSTRNQYWLWGVWLGDLSGGIIGAALYDTLIFEGEESPLNWRWQWCDLRPTVIRRHFDAWRKKIRVRNQTRKESWIKRYSARKSTKQPVQSRKKEAV